MSVNYQKFCSTLLEGIPTRTRNIISRRYGLEKDERETLESIGKDVGITRERVRQIEESGLGKIKLKMKKYPKIFQEFELYIKKNGGLKKESLLLDYFGEKNKSCVYFLLTLNNKIKRVSENINFHSIWMTDDTSLNLAKKTIDSLSQNLKKLGKPLTLKELRSLQPLNDNVLVSFLEVSKNIQNNQENLYGLRKWPEINPRGIKDKAFLIFKKTGKPLHFTAVTNKINGALTQTVHNELIKDSRFVLVGRGIYALSEWGYYPGQVKDVISKVLKESKKPLTKKEILNQVLKQRQVKANTVMLNLSNKNYFLKNSQGKYAVREA
ncbi:sigma factor-like helix-turn-helix DNA-binding protein [Patescibacteria group bacterium]